MYIYIYDTGNQIASEHGKKELKNAHQQHKSPTKVDTQKPAAKTRELAGLGVELTRAGLQAPVHA